jgi:hypothetical protein
MSKLSYLEKLLDEAEFEWKNLVMWLVSKTARITSPLAKASSGLWFRWNHAICRQLRL